MHIQRKLVLNAFTLRNFLHTSWEKADLSCASGSLTCLPHFTFLSNFRSSVSICSRGIPPLPHAIQEQGRLNAGLGWRYL